jgi:hypothetical protein
MFVTVMVHLFAFHAVEAIEVSKPFIVCDLAYFFRVSAVIGAGDLLNCVCDLVHQVSLTRDNF